MVDGNDKWGPGGILGLQIQARIVGGHKETNDSDTADIKQQDTDVNPADCLRQALSGVLGFTSSDLWMNLVTY